VGAIADRGSAAVCAAVRHLQRRLRREPAANLAEKGSRYRRVRYSYLAAYTLPPQLRLCVHTPSVRRQPLR